MVCIHAVLYSKLIIDCVCVTFTLWSTIVLPPQIIKKNDGAQLNDLTDLCYSSSSLQVLICFCCY